MSFGYDDAAHRYTLNGKVVPSATQIVGLLHKPFLAPGAAKANAEYVVDNIGAVVDLVVDDRPAALRKLKGIYRERWDAKRDLGSIVHEAAASWICDGLSVGLSEAARPYFAAFLQFRHDLEPDWHEEDDLMAVERAVYSEKHGYAGTFDGIFTVGGRRLLYDIKTGANVEPTDVALQLSAYRYADFIGVLGEDGTPERRPLPTVDGCAVLHLQPGPTGEGAYELWEVQADEEAWGQFLNLRSVFGFTQRADLRLETIAATERQAA